MRGKLTSQRHLAIHVGDFLARDAAPVFDRVVMNPPFSRQQDSLHILRALEWLRPSGRLVAVASASVLHRETALARKLRDTVISTGGSIEELPALSFLSAGTSVATVVVTINGTASRPSPPAGPDVDAAPPQPRAAEPRERS